MILNQRVLVISDMMQMLREDLKRQHGLHILSVYWRVKGEGLEWIVIGLVFISVSMTFVHIALKFTHHVLTSK